MTCIVGIRTPEGVYLGGDSAATNDSGYLVLLSSPKVFCLHQPPTTIMLGCTTSCRMMQLLHYELRLPAYEPGMAVEAYLVGTFINAVRENLKSGGFARKEDEREAGGSFLVGFHGRLFQVEEDYQISESLCEYAAVGSGATYALGSLYSTSHLDPEQRLTRALEAASFQNVFVKAPYTLAFLSTTNDYRAHTIQRENRAR